MQYNNRNHNTEINAMQQITLGPITPVVAVPREITVHLGAPEDEAENVTVPFLDYIVNVASSELYPTWPEAALEANIYAITSMAMNRIYTEWYRSRGFNFDITNSTQYDQAYVPNRGIFENIRDIVTKIFGQYIVREGQLQPYFTQFCDGRAAMCQGLHQWGTVDLASEGYTPMDILKYYYGENIEIITNAPISSVQDTYPENPLQLGDSSLDVLRMQYNLDRISLNYPGIPKIPKIDGYFGEDTKNAVSQFQRVFNLPVTGIIDEGTWYGIIRIFSAVTRLSELTGEGLLLKELDRLSAEGLLEGDIRPQVEFLQFALNILSAYYPTIPGVAITGIFDENTRNAVMEFQRTFNLQVTGAANMETLQAMYATTSGILNTLPPEQVFVPYLRWPGIIYKLGHESPGVYLIQEMLSYISLIMPEIPYIEPNGVFDEATENSVTAFQKAANLEPSGIVDQQTWEAIEDVYRKQRFGNAAI